MAREQARAFSPSGGTRNWPPHDQANEEDLLHHQGFNGADCERGKKKLNRKCEQSSEDGSPTSLQCTWPEM